jgi:hypothetical protein
MTIAFVLGNGTSRKPIQLDPLKQYGKIYGCNALYRSFEPDYLVAVDAKMINEICEMKYQMTHQVWTNPNKNLEKYPGLHFFKPSQGWSSGPTALWLATSHEHDLIYLLGFDYVGTNEQKFNNMYASTRNYRRDIDPPTYHGNWLRQTCTVIQKNPKKQYIRVVADQGLVFPGEDFKKFKNYTEITVTEFKNQYSGPKTL